MGFTLNPFKLVEGAVNAGSKAMNYAIDRGGGASHKAAKEKNYGKKGSASKRAAKKQVRREVNEHATRYYSAEGKARVAQSEARADAKADARAQAKDQAKAQAQGQAQNESSNYDVNAIISAVRQAMNEKDDVKRGQFVQEMKTKYGLETQILNDIANAITNGQTEVIPDYLSAWGATHPNPSQQAGGSMPDFDWKNSPPSYDDWLNRDRELYDKYRNSTGSTKASYREKFLDNLRNAPIGYVQQKMKQEGINPNNTESMTAGIFRSRQHEIPQQEQRQSRVGGAAAGVSNAERQTAAQASANPPGYDEWLKRSDELFNAEKRALGQEAHDLREQFRDSLMSAPVEWLRLKMQQRGIDPNDRRSQTAQAFRMKQQQQQTAPQREQARVGGAAAGVSNAEQQTAPQGQQTRQEQRQERQQQTAPQDPYDKFEQDLNRRSGNKGSLDAFLYTQDPDFLYEYMNRKGINKADMSNPVAAAYDHLSFANQEPEPEQPQPQPEPQQPQPEPEKNPFEDWDSRRRGAFSNKDERERYKTLEEIYTTAPLDYLGHVMKTQDIDPEKSQSLVATIYRNRIKPPEPEPEPPKQEPEPEPAVVGGAQAGVPETEQVKPPEPEPEAPRQEPPKDEFNDWARGFYNGKIKDITEVPDDWLQRFDNLGKWDRKSNYIPGSPPDLFFKELARREALRNPPPQAEPRPPVDEPAKVGDAAAGVPDAEKPETVVSPTVDHGKDVDDSEEWAMKFLEGRGDFAKGIENIPDKWLERLGKMASFDRNFKFREGTPGYHYVKELERREALKNPPPREEQASVGGAQAGVPETEQVKPPEPEDPYLAWKRDVNDAAFENYGKDPEGTIAKLRSIYGEAPVEYLKRLGETAYNITDWETDKGLLGSIYRDRTKPPKKEPEPEPAKVGDAAAGVPETEQVKPPEAEPRAPVAEPVVEEPKKPPYERPKREHVGGWSDWFRGEDPYDEKGNVVQYRRGGQEDMYNPFGDYWKKAQEKASPYIERARKYGSDVYERGRKSAGDYYKRASEGITPYAERARSSASNFYSGLTGGNEGYGRAGQLGRGIRSKWDMLRNYFANKFGG